MADTAQNTSQKVTREDLKKLAASELSKLRTMMRENDNLALALEAAQQKRAISKDRKRSRPPKANA